MAYTCWYKEAGQDPVSGGLLTVTEQEKVKRYHLSVSAASPLDMEEGAGITLDLGDLIGWMADYRCSEFWCQPTFVG